MRALVAELPEQLAWAAELEPSGVPAAAEGLVAGMGGSGFAGDVATVYAESQGRRVAVHKAYGLPSWAGDAAPLVVGVSHSGNTEETRSALEKAVESGLATVAISTGGALAEPQDGITHIAIPAGPQPRAAAGFLAGAALRVLEAAGVISGTGAALREAAEVTADMLDGDAEETANELAAAVEGRVTIIYGGAGMPAAAAARWKTQINENSKAPAWWSVFPELDHNEIVGWTAYPNLGGEALGVVFLADDGDHPRIAQRARLTAGLMDGVHIAGTVDSRGEGILARLFSLVLVGDLVSVALAERAGVDPVPVHVIESLKKSLEEEPA